MDYEGLSDGLNSLEKRKINCPCHQSNHGSPVILPMTLSVYQQRYPGWMYGSENYSCTQRECQSNLIPHEVGSIQRVGHYSTGLALCCILIDQEVPRISCATLKNAFQGHTLQVVRHNRIDNIPGTTDLP